MEVQSQNTEEKRSEETPKSVQGWSKTPEQPKELKAKEFIHCKNCNLAFVKNFALLKHLSSCKEKPKNPKNPPKKIKLSENQIKMVEKPYSCNKCDFSFAQENHLKMHITAVHEGKKLSEASIRKTVEELQQQNVQKLAERSPRKPKVQSPDKEPIEIPPKDPKSNKNPKETPKKD